MISAAGLLFFLLIMRTYAVEERVRQHLNSSCQLSDFEMEGNPFGRGSFGMVYRVRHRPTGEILAIKEIHSKRTHLLDAEADYATRFVHPYLGHALCVIRPTINQLFLVMELCPKGDLSQKVVQKTKQIVAKYGFQLLQAVHYLHEQGVGHFDIKPGNILITQQDDVRLIDFGLARSEKACRRGIRLGTPPFVAPEITLGRPYGKSADYFSLGITLAILFYGHLPYDATSTYATAEMADYVQGRLKLQKSHDPEIDALVARLCDPDPEQRWRLNFEQFDDLLSMPIFEGLRPIPMRAAMTAVANIAKNNSPLEGKISLLIIFGCIIVLGLVVFLLIGWLVKRRKSKTSSTV